MKGPWVQVSLDLQRPLQQLRQRPVLQAPAQGLGANPGNQEGGRYEEQRKPAMDGD